jgi:hypothetical protein
VHGSPLVFKGDAPPAYVPSRPLGADTERVLRDIFHLDPES